MTNSISNFNVLVVSSIFLTTSRRHFFYVHGTVHLSNTSFIKYQRDAPFSVYLVFYNSTCF